MLPIINRNTGMNRFFDNFFEHDFMNLFDKNEKSNIPAVNISENKDQFNIEIAAPGLEKSDFNIDLNGDIMTISSEKQNEVKDEDEKMMRKEFCYTSFERSFTLPISIERDKIKASHKNGVLHLILPKKKEYKDNGPKKIDIS